jgi:predicted ribosomally synthesized peptide with SipW-like signal peptide
VNKKTLWGGIAVGAAALGLAGGGTFAGWSDFNVRSEQVAAGHLTLGVGTSYEVGSDPLDLAPGINRYRAFYIASNDGDSVPNGNLAVTLKNLTDTENGCENNGEADAEDPARPRAAVASLTAAQLALDTDGVTAGARCTLPDDAGEASDLVSLQWRWTDPLPASTDCDSLNTYANEHVTGPSPYVNAAPSGAIGGLENFTTPIETLAPGQGLCVLMTINTFDHPSRPWNMNALQGDQLDFDVRFDLTQA